MRVMVTGSSGFVGKAVVRALEIRGDQVIRLVRSPSPAEGTMTLWSPEASRIIEVDHLEDLDAVVHLAGENIATGRWTPVKKAAIRNSRVQGTALLARSLAALKHPPKVFLSASAIGYYGDRGDEELTEESSLDEGFLPGVCRDWENAAKLAAGGVMRVICMRIGFVLSAYGGGLAKMLPAFRKGLGGRMGSGRQWMSWIHLDDVVGAMLFALDHETLEGPVNFTAPTPLRNTDFTKALAGALRRPALFPLPGFVAHLLFGEMADALMLSSARVYPRRLEKAGYPFLYPTLESALREVLS